MKRKIIVKMIGGLGNQLFIYCFARNIQEKYGGELYFDLDTYKKYKIRDFRLIDLTPNIHYKILEKKDLGLFSFYKYKLAVKFYHVFQYLYQRILKTNRISDKIYRYLVDKGYIFNFDMTYHKTVINKKLDRLFIYGYFQSDEYFADLSEILRKEITESFPKANDYYAMKNDMFQNIALSIRLGDDYLKSELNVFSVNYYYHAIDEMKKKFKNIRLYIFSDDYKKVKMIFKFPCEVVYMEGLNDINQLYYLSRFNCFILSNSSFSWFGEFLSNDESKTTIVPSRWHSKFIVEDIYTDYMIKVEVQ